MAIYTDIADEIYTSNPPSASQGIRHTTARSGNITVTRVQVCRPGMARPQGHYITLQMANIALLSEKDEAYIGAVAHELRTLLPAEGSVLVVGVGNRRVTADALGPRTAGQILVTRGLAEPSPADSLGLREVAAIAPGVSGNSGIALVQTLSALVRSVRPSAVLCVDSLCGADPARLGRTVQLSDTGLSPARPGSGKCITRGQLGVPVIAVGIPTMMEADELCGARGLVVCPRELDSLVRKGSTLLALAINKALQPRLSIPELCYLAN